MPIESLPSFVLHDMANAVNAIAGVSDTLGQHRDRLTAAQHDALVASLQRQSGMLRRLLGDLGDLAQLEAGAFSVALRPVRVREVVDEAISQVNPPDGAVRVRVPADVEVLADPERLLQVVVNLLTNARVHGGPTTWIDATGTGSMATITVSDDGDGLDAGLAATLFEPYTRGPSSSRRPGSGLGLSIVRGLVRAFGGDVRYVRRPRGSQFLVELEALAPAPTREGPPPAAPFDHAAVVYSDDTALEVELARLVSDGLDAGGAVVVVATPAHWEGARMRLGARGRDLRRAMGTGQVVVRDATALLATLQEGDGIEAERFDLHTAGLIAETTRRWGDVRVFGEMVSLLREAGDLVSALDLERHWNVLLGRHRFGLLCGHRAPGSTRLDDGGLAGICAQHGFVFQG